jgi:D-xylose transport system substrate-binding protein
VIDPSRRVRPIIVAAATLAVVLTLAGAVSAQSPLPATPSVVPASPGASGAVPSTSPTPSVPVALLLPNTSDLRWEGTDKPAFSAKLTEVCPTAVLDARNAGGDATLQAQQAQDALEAGAKVLVVAPVDAAGAAAIVTAAKAAGAKVVSYDTVVTGAAPDYHIGYDPAAVGTLVAEAVLTANSEAAAAASPEPTVGPGGVRVVLINGPQGDASAAAWTAKVKSALEAEATVVNEATVTAATADEGQRVIAAAIAAVGADGFDAVISSDDAVASGVIAGLKAASIEPATRQVTGGVATVPGVQQVLIDQQLLTTFAPPTAEAELAAVVACGLATGQGLPKSLTPTPVNNGTADIPSLLLTPVAVTSDGSIAGTRSVATTVVAEHAFGPDTTALICTPDYETACINGDIDLSSPSPSPAASPSPVAPSPIPSTVPSAAPASPGTSPAPSVAPTTVVSPVPAATVP